MSRPEVYRRDRKLLVRVLFGIRQEIGTLHRVGGVSFRQ